jgi:hypothetical protein
MRRNSFLGCLGGVVLLFGCAKPCPPCRCLTVAADEPVGLTMPYTLEIEDGVRCEVVPVDGDSHVMSCYPDDPTAQPH